MPDPFHYSRRKPRRSRPIRAAAGDVHGARSCLGPARSGHAEIREDAADAKVSWERISRSSFSCATKGRRSLGATSQALNQNFNKVWTCKRAAR
jgi:hypothetical protein